jgi:hypothetical protein
LRNGADQRSMEDRSCQAITDQADVDHKKDTSGIARRGVDSLGDFGAGAPSDFIIFSLSCRGRRVQPSHTLWFNQLHPYLGRAQAGFR